MSKTKTYILFLLAVFLLPALPQLSFATGPDTLWTRNSQNGLDGILEENFEFHPTNDSIFIFTGRTYSNNVLIDSSTVHFVNTITGQTFLKYAPIHMAHYTPDGNFLIGHNDSTIAYISLDSMKPVRSYPIMKNALGNFTIDEVIEGLNNNEGRYSVIKFEIQPNPSKGEFEIILPNIKDVQNISISIFDLNGRLIKELNERFIRKLPVSIGNISSGIYLLKVSFNGNLLGNVKLLNIIK